MERFVLYRYLSATERQVDRLSLEAQLRDINFYLSTLDGAEVLFDFVEAQPDDDFGRETLNKAIAEARANGATLLAARPDRFSKRPTFFRKLVEDDQIRLAVAIFPGATKQQIHDYVLLRSMEDAFRRMQSNQIKTLRPDMSNPHVTLSASEMQSIAGPLRAGGMSFRQIAQHLDALGYAARRGGRWQASQVMRMLRAGSPQR